MSREIGGPSPEEMGIEQKGREKVEVVEQTDNGLWLKRVEKDEKGRVTREEIRQFAESDAEERDEEKYHYEKSYEFEEDSELPVRETGKNQKGTEWAKDFEYDAQGRILREVGENTEGSSKGHKWEKTYEYDDEAGTMKEKGSIHAQGEDQSKPGKGHTWENDRRSIY